ncbi:SDR family NAD(P)-dependent oxidoreductase [Verrucosispora sp. FIM060022]|uniref:SDR family oxidoreductase n=1 Tax=Verrucosispora sp. FIM060022 TaxID=1479020 RepID=UPI000F88492A|nr:SDR family NAD(P)-dependent oxidoreductase [Verrucosispora sp. FIM060022]RUL94358.1 SDR family NAD(P)-dependent oxidoreductase [Verrucosispora sp. FIM060022]
MNDVPRRVVVTGAGTGIGRATARGFSADGAQVLAVGRRGAPLADTATGHPLIAPLAVDVTAADAPRRVVNAALDRYGRLDVLVNNAGIAGAGRLAGLDEAATHAQLATNLLAAAVPGRPVLPRLGPATTIRQCRQARSAQPASPVAGSAGRQAGPTDGARPTDGAGPTDGSSAGRSAGWHKGNGVDGCGSGNWPGPPAAPLGRCATTSSTV